MSDLDEFSLREALETIVTADEELIERMEDGLTKKQAEFVREKWDLLRIDSREGGK